MAISYTNTIKSNILDPIEKLIEDEFNIPVLDKHIGNESIVITPVDDTLIENWASAQTRSYDISIVYTMVSAGGFENIKDHLTNRSERIKRLLFNNSNYSPSGALKFFNGSISSITYENDDDDPEVWRANISFTCDSLESL